MIFSRADCPAFTMATNGGSGILQTGREIFTSLRGRLVRALIHFLPHRWPFEHLVIGSIKRETPHGLANLSGVKKLHRWALVQAVGDAPPVIAKIASSVHSRPGPSVDCPRLKFTPRSAWR
jgi:hypothetical protein